MREILFRGKRIDNGEWVEGYLSQRSGSNGKIFESHIILDAYEQIGVLNFGRPGGLVSEIGYECFKVDHETVCQYTGLKDKNGRRKYEGDIFRAGDGEFIQKFIIRWNDDFLEWSAECIGDLDGTLPLCEFGPNEIEVIGNVFDNSELVN